MAFNRENSCGCPCDGCMDRVVEPNCHMICKPYLEWKERMQASADAKRHDRMDVISEAKKRQIWRARRYSRQNNKTPLSKHD